MDIDFDSSNEPPRAAGGSGEERQQYRDNNKQSTGSSQQLKVSIRVSKDSSDDDSSDNDDQDKELTNQVPQGFTTGRTHERSLLYYFKYPSLIPPDSYFFKQEDPAKTKLHLANGLRRRLRRRKRMMILSSNQCTNANKELTRVTNFCPVLAAKKKAKKDLKKVIKKMSKL